MERGRGFTPQSTTLVTGGSGFIDSHSILQLLTAGHQVGTTVRTQKREGDMRATLEESGADLPICAMTHPIPEGERLLTIAGDCTSMFDVARVLNAAWAPRTVRSCESLNSLSILKDLRGGWAIVEKTDSEAVIHEIKRGTPEKNHSEEQIRISALGIVRRGERSTEVPTRKLSLKNRVLRKH